MGAQNDTDQAEKTYDGFIALMKWGSIITTIVTFAVIIVIT